MVRVLGASFERIEIKDLGDVIYYQQQKEYTDQQFDASKDLRREMAKGKIIKIKGESPPSTSVAENVVYTAATPSTSFSLSDIKTIISDSLKPVKELIGTLGPMMAEMVRQEIAKLPSIRISSEEAAKKSEFVGPEYIPTISTEGLKTSIDIKENVVSGDSVSDNLEALRKMQNK